MNTPPAEPASPQPAAVDTFSSLLSIPLLVESAVVLVAFPGMTLFLLGSLTYLRDLLSFWVVTAHAADSAGLLGAVAALVQLDGGRVAGGLLLAGLLLNVARVYAKIHVGPREPTLWRGRDMRGWWQIGSILWSVFALLLAFTTLTLWLHAFPTVYHPSGTTVIDGWGGAVFLVVVVLSLFVWPLFPVAFLRQVNTDLLPHTDR
jgi:hypothetical protein